MGSQKQTLISDPYLILDTWHAPGQTPNFLQSLRRARSCLQNNFSTHRHGRKLSASWEYEHPAVHWGLWHFREIHITPTTGFSPYSPLNRDNLIGFISLPEKATYLSNMSTRALGNLRNGRNDITSLQILFGGGHLTTLGSAGRCFSGQFLGRLGTWSCFKYRSKEKCEMWKHDSYILLYLKRVAILVGESGSPSRKGHTRWPVSGITRSIAEYWAKEWNSSNTDFSKTHARGFSPVIAKTMIVKWHVVTHNLHKYKFL